MNKTIELGNKAMRDYLNEEGRGNPFFLVHEMNDFHSNWASIMRVIDLLTLNGHAVHLRLGADGTDCEITAYGGDGSRIDTVHGELIDGIENSNLSIAYSAILQFLDTIENQSNQPC
jgi:hypothetical protein